MRSLTTTRVGAAVLLGACTALLAPAWAAARINDEVPPIVLERGAEPVGEELRLSIEVVDPSGAGEVTAFVRRAGESEFTARPMRAAGNGLFELHVPAPNAESPWVAYWFEARDAHGNGPASNGSKASPFIARFEGAVAGAAEPGLLNTKNVGLLAIAAGVGLLFLLLHLQRRSDSSRERAFWLELLGPLSALRGAELDLALEQLCARGHYHPVRGDLRIDVATARRQLALLSRSHPDQLEAIRQRDAEQRSRQVPQPRENPNPLQDLEEELFWYRVLSPLLERSGPSLESELRALAGRSLAHPKLGRHYFDVPTLRTHLALVRGMDPDELLSRTADSGGPSANEPARGASLIEMLVVMALIAIVMGAILVTLMPLVAPVERAAEQLDGLLRQARAAAMATVHVHRVRPLDEDSLVVESARSCGSAAWSLEERMRLDFAGGVTLSDVAWSVCFDGRGLASDDIDLTLLHPKLPPQQLELLRGGMLRWI